jgi:two-component system, sensor histidine kinase RegB
LIFVARLAALRRARERELLALCACFTRNEGHPGARDARRLRGSRVRHAIAILTLLTNELGEQDSKEEYSTMRALIAQYRDRVRALATPEHERMPGNGSVLLDEVIERWRLVRPTIDLVRSGNLSETARVHVSVGHLLQALPNSAAYASEQAV